MISQQFRAWLDCTDARLFLYWWHRLITFCSSRIWANVLVSSAGPKKLVFGSFCRNRWSMFRQCLWVLINMMFSIIVVNHDRPNYTDKNKHKNTYNSKPARVIDIPMWNSSKIKKASTVIWRTSMKG